MPSLRIINKFDQTDILVNRNTVSHNAMYKTWLSISKATSQAEMTSAVIWTSLALLIWSDWQNDFSYNKQVMWQQTFMFAYCLTYYLKKAVECVVRRLHCSMKLSSVSLSERQQVAVVTFDPHSCYRGHLPSGLIITTAGMTRDLWPLWCVWYQDADAAFLLWSSFSFREEQKHPHSFLSVTDLLMV